MKLKQITHQHRRDFYGIYECEFCHTEREVSGYDDRNFHDNVVPDIKCKKCNKSTNSEGGAIDIIKTKYPEGYQI